MTKQYMLQDGSSDLNEQELAESFAFCKWKEDSVVRLNHVPPTKDGKGSNIAVAEYMVYFREQHDVETGSLVVSCSHAPQQEKSVVTRSMKQYKTMLSCKVPIIEFDTVSGIGIPYGYQTVSLTFGSPDRYLLTGLGAAIIAQKLVTAAMLPSLGSPEYNPSEMPKRKTWKNLERGLPIIEGTVGY